MESQSKYVFSASGVSKRFGGVVALDEVSFNVGPAEIVGLIGDNGAGKSTLVKVLSGAVHPDSGTLTVAGKDVEFRSSADARQLGIETVYQDLALAPHLNVSANLYLGRELRKHGLLRFFGFLDKSLMQSKASGILENLGVSIRDYASPVGSLSGGQRQGIAVARAAAWTSTVIFLDEPTAALGVRQTVEVEQLIRRIRDDRGISVVLVSHNMEQVMKLADRVHVLRLGKNVTTFEKSRFSGDDFIAAMTGLYHAELP
ncbi:MAG: ATP-binding cassette domain-containing protein [Herbaspirillum sp.]